MTFHKTTRYLDKLVKQIKHLYFSVSFTNLNFYNTRKENSSVFITAVFHFLNTQTMLDLFLQIQKLSSDKIFIVKWKLKQNLSKVNHKQLKSDRTNAKSEI